MSSASRSVLKLPNTALYCLFSLKVNFQPFILFWECELMSLQKPLSFPGSEVQSEHSFHTNWKLTKFLETFTAITILEEHPWNSCYKQLFFVAVTNSFISWVNYFTIDVLLSVYCFQTFLLQVATSYLAIYYEDAQWYVSMVMQCLANALL